MEHFASDFIFDDAPTPGARIGVVGVGGGGGNAVNNMVRKGIVGVSFLAINTDNQALANSGAQTRIQAGRKSTAGLGAGARPEIGAEAVEESRADIEQALQGFDMVFITAGMGGGTGTGGAPVVAQIARKMGVLTVGVVTKPFLCEGRPRMKSAEQGIAQLREHVDTIIVIPNENLLDAYPDATLEEAFGKVDDVLFEATRGISDLITTHGLINLDFADVKTTVQNGGLALMGAATAAGEKRAEVAALAAISSPLLDGISIAGAHNVLVNITAGKTLGMREVSQATLAIQQEAGDEVAIILGTVIDEAMGDEVRVTVIATGFDRSQQAAPASARPASASAPAPAPAAAPPQAAPAPQPSAPMVISTPTALPRTPTTTPVRPGNYTQRTEPVSSMRPGFYRGEKSLSDLDEPAYLRRRPSGNPDSRLSPADAGSVDEPPARPLAENPSLVHPDPAPTTGGRVRRSLDETDRTPTARPSEPPTFIRRMMD